MGRGREIVQGESGAFASSAQAERDARCKWGSISITVQLDTYRNVSNLSFQAIDLRQEISLSTEL